jgi:adenosylcobinamide-GDP ribazoletransferase
VVCVLLTKTAAFGHIDQARFLALLIVPAYSRSAMMFAMRLLPYARAEDGTGRPFFETPLTMPDFRFVLVPACFSLLLGWRGVLFNLFFAAVTAALIILYRKKLGGVTGDMLGAMTEVTEAVLLLAVSTGGLP